ncbi:MAG: hypothetical protein KAI59_05805 [Planctomycetes bacterium]|nr:hypothetical protein [Planctomycetota bacterium]
MKKRGFLFMGIGIGIVATFLFGMIACYLDPDTIVVGEPQTFGDIKIWAQKPSIVDGNKVPSGLYQGSHRKIWMTKDNIPFLMISQNEAAKTAGLLLLKNEHQPILCLDALEYPGQWGQAIYSSGGEEIDKPVGDVLVDIDFDGHFDFKLVFDYDGKNISRSIFIDKAWQEIEHCNIEQGKAAIGEKIYTFDPNSGWLLIEDD